MQGRVLRLSQSVEKRLSNVGRPPTPKHSMYGILCRLLIDTAPICRGFQSIGSFYQSRVYILHLAHHRPTLRWLDGSMSVYLFNRFCPWSGALSHVPKIQIPGAFVANSLPSEFKGVKDTIPQAISADCGAFHWFLSEPLSGIPRSQGDDLPV